MEPVTDPLAALEAVLFVAEQPVPVADLSVVLELSQEQVEENLALLQACLAERESGLVLRSGGGGWRLYTRPDLSPVLERFAASPTARRLSSAALEVLAIVAYRQPATRSQVAEIRGVDSDSALGSLERQGLLASSETHTAGRALLYTTTPLFLEIMGLDTLSDLPPLADHVPPPVVMDTLEDTFRTTS